MKRAFQGFALFLCLWAAPVFGWTLLAQGLQGWSTKTLTVYFSPQNCPLSESTITEAIDSALGVWNGVATTRISLQRANSDVSVTVADFLAETAAQTPTILCDPNFSTSVGDSADAVPAATMKLSGSPLVYGGILLNAQAAGGANISQLSFNQLVITIAHELGHVLGLGHSSDSNALMYYSIGNKVQAVATLDDEDGITHLYPRDEFTGGPLGCGAVHRASIAWGDLASLGMTLMTGIVGCWLARNVRVPQT
jgi:Matrixin